MLARDGEPAFQEPWQAHAFAMATLLHRKGTFTWSEWAEALSDFVADPLHTTGCIYEAAGIHASELALRSMATWVKEHPRQDLSRPRAADLAPYGIDPDEARARFAEYVNHFDVEYDGL